MFTRDQIEEIKKKLIMLGTKDTQFPDAHKLNGEEIIAIVQDGENKKIPLSSIINDDFINVSKDTTEILTLSTAVSKIDINNRKLGQVITFKDSANSWAIRQFTGSSLDNWNDISLWKSISGIDELKSQVETNAEDISVLSDEIERHDASILNLNTDVSKLKDKDIETSSSLSELTTRVDTLKSQADTNTSNISSINTEVSTLQSKVDENTTSISQINTELDNKNGEIAQINTKLEEHTESINANITTDRIEDGAVTSEKIATTAFDSTLSVSGKIAPADVVGLRIAEATNKQITPDMLSESTKQYIEASGGGTVTNLADDEDITSVNNLLKFANKDYLPASYSGLGRVYLRKNFVDGKNVLTQDMISNENTIYIIQYDYDLNGATITIPDNCTLDFQGGSLSNGNVIFNNTEISSDVNAVILNVDFEGNILNNEIYASWFNILPKNSDNSFYLNRLFNSIANNSDGYKIIFSRGKYNFKSTIKPKSPVSLCGNYPLESMDWQYRNSDYITVFIYCPDDKGKSNITKETIENFGLYVEPSIFIDNNKYDGKYSVLQLLNLYIRTDLSAGMPDIQSCTVMLKDIGGSVIKNCEIERFNVCIMKLGSQYSVFEHNSINACTVFFLLPKLSSEESSNNVDTTENLNYNSISNCVIVFKSIPLSDDYVRVSMTEMFCFRNTIQGCEYYLYNMDGAFNRITQNGTYYEANKNESHALIVYTASQKFLSNIRTIPILSCYNEFYNNGRNYIYAECGCIHIQGGSYITTKPGDYLIKIIEAKDEYVFLSIDAAVYGFKTIDANSVISKMSLRGFKIRNLNILTNAADNEFNVGNIGIYTGLDEFVNIEKGISSYNSKHNFISFKKNHNKSLLSISKDIDSIWIGSEQGNNKKYGGPNTIDKSLGLPIETLEEYKEREENEKFFGYGGTVIKSAITDSNITMLHLLNAKNKNTKMKYLNSKFVSNNLVLPNHNLKTLTPYDTSKEINGQTYACSRNEAGIIYNNAPYIIKVYPKGYKNVFSDKIDYGYLHKGDFFIMQSNNTLNVVNKEASTKNFSIEVTETEEGALHSGNLSITIDNETFELNFENATVDDIKSLIRYNVVSDKFFFEGNLVIVFTDIENIHTFNCVTDDSTLTIRKVTTKNASNYEYTSYKLADVLNTYGNFANKPDGAPIGFVYFCTDRQTSEGATNGIEIIHKGDNTWVDALGRIIS